MPGKFIQAMKAAGTQNPVIMLDEIDKIGAEFSRRSGLGAARSARPRAERDFLDHYLDLRFDLSKVLFICTANQLDTIPGPLLDRMELIHLSGYIAEEKLQIAALSVAAPARARVGRNAPVKIDSATLRAIIDGYARDAGVRRLEKQTRQDHP